MFLLLAETRLEAKATQNLRKAASETR